MPSCEPTATTPLDTLELRWFGRLDGGPERAPAHLAEVSQHTVDRYAPTGADCGIKLRAGRIEVKQRLPQRHAPTEPLSARRLQAWRKQSLPVTARERVACASWIAVTKERELDFDQREGVTIQVERAAVTVGDERWWTVALELSGELDAVERPPVLHLAGRLLSHFDGALGDAFCGSYPEWLAVHHRGEGSP